MCVCLYVCVCVCRTCSSTLRFKAKLFNEKLSIHRSQSQMSQFYTW